jgi:hypothetical protein
MTDWVSIGTGVVSGLFGGSLGGVLAAPLIGDRAERGKRRHVAKTVLRAEFLTYRDTLHYDLEQRDVRPIGYASIVSQEHLAEVVVRESPHLARRTRRRVRDRLNQLVGARTVALAESRAHLPTDGRDPEKETGRVEVIERHIRLNDGEVDFYGQLGVVLKSPNEPDHRDHHAAAMATLQAMLDDVAP